MNSISFLLLFAGGVVLTFGDLIMKKWVDTGNRNLYLFGLTIYFLGLNFLAQSFKYKNIAVASIIFVIFNVITLLLVSWIVYKEKLTTFQILGVTLGLISVAILELSEK